MWSVRVIPKVRGRGSLPVTLSLGTSCPFPWATLMGPLNDQSIVQACLDAELRPLRHLGGPHLRISGDVLHDHIMLDQEVGPDA